MKTNHIDLESAVMDAARFSRLAYKAFCNIGFDKAAPPALSDEDSELVYWAMSQLLAATRDAERAFYAEIEEGKDAKRK